MPALASHGAGAIAGIRAMTRPALPQNIAVRLETASKDRDARLRDRSPDCEIG